MKLPDHPFDPCLQPVFSTSDSASLVTLPDSRDLFFGLIHSSENVELLPAAYRYLKQQCRAVELHCTEPFFSVYQQDSVEQLTVITAETVVGNIEALSHYTPVILTELHYLHAVSQAATSQSPLAVEVMAVYLQLSGKQSYRPLFEGLLHASGLELPAIHSRAFIKQLDINDSVFDFASVQLAFVVHCRAFFPEMLGFSLACCKTTMFANDEDNTSLHPFICARQQLLDAQVPAIIALIQHYLSLFPEQTALLWHRVQTGFYVYQQQVQRCQQLEAQQILVSPQQELIQLLQRIVPDAVGHHGAIKLADKGLDDWFAQTPFDGDGFLAALKQSAYINKAAPERSVLLRLFEFGGPMFGVLNQAERDLLKTWVLSDVLTQSAPMPYRNPLPIAVTQYEIAIGTDETDYNKLNHRQLYYYLVNADVLPGVLDKARQHVHSVLWRAQYLNRLPFKHYSHEAFAEYIHGVYQAEVDSYAPLKNKPRLSKSAYLWGIQQFSPAILMDGCWLQHSKQLTLLANGSIGDILFKIYDDETGNGIAVQNHPFMYQQLLDSVAMTVPAINTQAFSDYTGFIDSAFDIPVYLMAMSKFPIAFLPELLGLNMAIEISGLGKVYLRLAQELRYYGINPAIVNVHISIDNMATGHSALALTAIQQYMDDVLAKHGKRAMHTHWRRIFTGYCSLQTASAVFKLALVIQYWLKRKDRILVEGLGDTSG
jgi:Iron-containing redox enzyme